MKKTFCLQTGVFVKKPLDRVPFWPLVCLALLVSCSTFAETSAKDTGSALQFPKYPVPSHISAKAQAVLRKPIHMGRAEWVPSTAGGWISVRERLAKQYKPILNEALKSAPVTVNLRQVAGVTVREIVPNDIPIANRDKVLINFHGGAYLYFGGELSVLEGLSLAVAGSYRVLAVDYRMPPEFPFPAAVDDALAVYRAILQEYGAENIALFGASAGGGLVAATILSARNSGLAMPAAAVLNTPWSDLSKTGDSYFTNDGVDPVLSRYDGMLAGAAKQYAGKAKLTHPLVSPVYADYSKGFSPSLLVTGTRDLLLSATVRLHRRLRQSGQLAELHVFEAMWHAFSGDEEMQETKDYQREVLGFLNRHLHLEGKEALPQGYVAPE